MDIATKQFVKHIHCVLQHRAQVIVLTDAIVRLYQNLRVLRELVPVGNTLLRIIECTDPSKTLFRLDATFLPWGKIRKMALA